MAHAKKKQKLASILSTGTCKKLEGLDASCNEMGAIGNTNTNTNTNTLILILIPILTLTNEMGAIGDVCV